MNVRNSLLTGPRWLLGKLSKRRHRLEVERGRAPAVEMGFESLEFDFPSAISGLLKVLHHREDHQCKNAVQGLEYEVNRWLLRKSSFQESKLAISSHLEFLLEAGSSRALGQIQFVLSSVGFFSLSGELTNALALRDLGASRTNQSLQRIRSAIHLGDLLSALKLMEPFLQSPLQSVSARKSIEDLVRYLELWQEAGNQPQLSGKRLPIENGEVWTLVGPRALSEDVREQIESCLPDGVIRVAAPGKYPEPTIGEGKSLLYMNTATQADFLSLSKEDRNSIASKHTALVTKGRGFIADYLPKRAKASSLAGNVFRFGSPNMLQIIAADVLLHGGKLKVVGMDMFNSKESYAKSSTYSKHGRDLLPSGGIEGFEFVMCSATAAHVAQTNWQFVHNLKHHFKDSDHQFQQALSQSQAQYLTRLEENIGQART